MASTFSMRSLLRALPRSANTPTVSTTITRPILPPSRLLAPCHPLAPQPTTTTTAAAAAAATRAFATTAPRPARQTNKKKPTKAGGGQPNKKKLDPAAARALARKRKQQAAAKLDPKIAALMKFLYAASQAPAPLRMARQRHLRHWAVHRAWQLHRRQAEHRRETELMRLQQSMASACEALRALDGPGTRPTGWLFRRAMLKEGVWARDAVPIEYARPLVETPGPRPWNHEWKRM